MQRRMLSKDPFTGLETHHEYDPATEETRIILTGDAEPVLEENKRLANDTQYSKKGIKQEFWKYASIPAGIQVKWLIEHGVDVYNTQHAERMGKLLELPEYKYLKCTTGKHKFKDR